MSTAARDIVIRLRVDLQQQIPKIDSSAAQQSTEAMTRAMEQANAENVRAAQAAMQAILQQASAGSAQIASEAVKGAQSAVDQILKHVATQGESIAKEVGAAASTAAQDAAKRVEISVKAAAAAAATAAKSAGSGKPDEEHLNVELQLQYEELAGAIMKADTARSAGLRTIREEVKLYKEEMAVNAGMVRGTLDLVRATVLLTGARREDIQFLVKGIAAIEAATAAGRAATVIAQSLAAARAMQTVATAGGTAAEIAHAGALARSAVAARAAAFASGLLNIAMGPVGLAIIAVTAAVAAYVHWLHEEEEAEKKAAEAAAEQTRMIKEAAEGYEEIYLAIRKAADAQQELLDIQSQARDRSLGAVETFGTPEQVLEATKSAMEESGKRVDMAARKALEARTALRSLEEETEERLSRKEWGNEKGAKQLMFGALGGSEVASNSKSTQQELTAEREEAYQIALKHAKAEEAVAKQLMSQLETAAEILRKEQERTESQDERIGRLDKGQRAQLERIEAKRAAGQELSTGDLKFVEDTLGRTEFTGEQFRNRGKGGSDQFGGLFGGGLSPEERKKVEEAEARRGLDSEGTTEQRIAALSAENEKLKSSLEKTADKNIDFIKGLVDFAGREAAKLQRLKEHVDQLTSAPQS